MSVCGTGLKHPGQFQDLAALTPLASQFSITPTFFQGGVYHQTPWALPREELGGWMLTPQAL